MIRLFKRLLFGTPPLTLEHPILGRLTLLHGKRGPYWMKDAYSDDELSISIETVSVEPPSEEQVVFFQTVTGDWDAVFQRVSQDVINKYRSYVRKPFPERWRTALQPGGIGVPLAGDETAAWDITFVCVTDDLGYLFNCWFEGGELRRVSVDT